MTPAKALWLLMFGLTAVAWVTFANHPTARNLRTAVVDTLSL